MKITRKLLRDWNACWADEQIVEKLGKRKSVSPRAVANDESISLDDRLWVLCRALAHLDEHAARGFAIECALTVAHLTGDEADQAQCLGLLNDLLQIEDLPPAAWDAAWGAARNAAWGVAWGAARDAARNAAGGVAWGAAWDAAWGAARNAAGGVAWGAARDAARDAAGDAARNAAGDAARNAARNAARDAALKEVIARALEWLGDEAE